MTTINSRSSSATGLFELKPLLIIAALLAVSLFVLNAKRPTNPYYFDEVSWICEGRIYEELISGRFQSGVWIEDLVQRLNPQIGKVVIGWFMMQTYGYPGFDAFNCPSWGILMHAKSLSALSPLQQEVLITMRLPMMVAGALSVVVLFGIGRKLQGDLFGIISSLLLMTSPLFQVTTNRAMPDAFLLLWFLLFMYWVVNKFLTSPHQLWKKIDATSLLLGSFIGLGTSIKAYGAYGAGIIITLWGSMFIIDMINNKMIDAAGLIKFGTNIVLIVVGMVAMVYILNPVFWQNPEALRNWTAEWTAFQEWLQRDDWAYKDIALFTPLERATVIIRHFLLPGDWAMAIPLPGSLFIIGLILVLRQFAITHLRPVALFLVSWLSVMGFVLLLYTPFYIERYFLLLLPPFILFETVVLEKAIARVRSFFSKTA